MLMPQPHENKNENSAIPEEAIPAESATKVQLEHSYSNQEKITATTPVNDAAAVDTQVIDAEEAKSTTSPVADT